MREEANKLTKAELEELCLNELPYTCRMPMTYEMGWNIHVMLSEEVLKLFGRLNHALCVMR